MTMFIVVSIGVTISNIIYFYDGRGKYDPPAATSYVLFPCSHIVFAIAKTMMTVRIAGIVLNDGCDYGVGDADSALIVTRSCWIGSFRCLMPCPDSKTQDPPLQSFGDAERDFEEIPLVLGRRRLRCPHPAVQFTYSRARRSIARMGSVCGLGSLGLWLVGLRRIAVLRNGPLHKGHYSQFLAVLFHVGFCFLVPDTGTRLEQPPGDCDPATECGPQWLLDGILQSLV